MYSIFILDVKKTILYESYGKDNQSFKSVFVWTVKSHVYDGTDSWNLKKDNCAVSLCMCLVGGLAECLYSCAYIYFTKSYFRDCQEPFEVLFVPNVIWAFCILLTSFF
jgi:hypothetical protein